jgi:UDP-glucose 4-epimerase
MLSGRCDFLKGFRILVTGGAGFIGSHLVERLIELGNSVVVLDDFSEGTERNLVGVLKNPKLKVVHGDVLNAETVDSLVKKADYVFHLAVKCLSLGLEDPMTVHEVNATGTLNVCMACKKHRIKRLIYVSSSEVYGTAKYVPIDENHPLCPTTPYAASKAAGEFYVWSFYHTWRLPAIIVRPFNTYGPRCRIDRYCAVIPSFVKSLQLNEPIVVYGDGNQTRDFTYISDTVEGIVRAAECDELVGDMINIARGEEVAVNRIAEIVLNLMEMNGKIDQIFEKERPGDVRRHLADISKARKLLRFDPKVHILEGIKTYIEWKKESEKK